jgi:hypothetical protein
MNDDVFNLEVRKFLKRFGVTAQREIERAVRDAVEQGRLPGDAAVQVRATLEIDALAENHVIEDAIRLE